MTEINKDVFLFFHKADVTDVLTNLLLMRKYYIQKDSFKFNITVCATRVFFPNQIHFLVIN